MPSETEFTGYITARDRVRVKFTLERGVPEHIVVQLECEVGGRWWEARRYDNRHGEVHMHVTPWDTARDRTITVSVGDLRHAIRSLTNELGASWQAIRARLVADLGVRQDDT